MSIGTSNQHRRRSGSTSRAKEAASKVGRPAIPAQTQRELWARSAGRCEFRGCNKIVYKDQLTQTRSNLTSISHIVAFSPDGPRGDAVRSPLLATNISNLMITCKVHGKIIDDQERVADYPEALLLEFKREHEQRVLMLTESKEDAQTHVLLVQASIDGRDVCINETDAFRAILPKYPAEESAGLIDLSGIQLPAAADGFFSVSAPAVTRSVEQLLARRAGKRIKSLSVFALAPIPLLIHLGHLLGDVEHVDLYQRHRDTQDWTWKGSEEWGEFFEVCAPDEEEVKSGGGRDVALLLSISQWVKREEVAAALGGEPLVYEIRAKSPGLDFLRSHTRLQVFGYEARKLLGELQEAYDRERTVHVFAAVPAPAAIEFGRCVKGYHPQLQTYEYAKQNRKYVPALTVNAGKQRHNGRS